MSRKRDLDRRIRRLEEQLEMLSPAEPIPVHIRGIDGHIEPPLTAEELANEKTIVIAQVVDGRRKH